MPRDPDEEADKAAFMALDVKLAALKEQMAALKEQIEATFQEKIAVLSEQMNILKKYVLDEGLLAKLKRQQAELSELSESGERRPH
jgi:predicted nuclease with TOPRIM domain